MITDERGNVDLVKLKKTLQLLDRPFILDIWNTSTSMSNRDAFGTYMKNIAMKQYRSMGWADSVFDTQFDEGDIETTRSETPQSSLDSIDTFVVTDKIIDKWGVGYTDQEYYYFEKKWNKLINNYGEKTSFHIEGLITYIRFRVKEELATANGLVKEAKDWATMAKDAATAAKINVSQLSKSDISGGVDLLPQLFEAVETEVGIIPILPKLKEQPYDDADLIIWCIINYARRLEDKPRIAYKDIWRFYDDMLTEYFTQQGYAPDMVEKEKIKRNNVFRDLGEVYKEPIYENDH